MHECHDLLYFGFTVKKQNYSFDFDFKKGETWSEKTVDTRGHSPALALVCSQSLGPPAEPRVSSGISPGDLTKPGHWLVMSIRSLAQRAPARGTAEFSAPAPGSSALSSSSGEPWKA